MRKGSVSVSGSGAIPVRTSRFLLITFILLPVLLNNSCTEKKKRGPVMFAALDGERTGIRFKNQLNPSPQFNLFSYMYYYNGAGVGAGDFNNDGKTDLFFAANQGENKLYLNEGGLHFKEISQEAGVPQDGSWSTGVSVADINSDGMLDIYICKVGRYKILQGKNQLLICTGIDSKGIPHYRDAAASCGLDFSGFSTQAAFFDFDKDGDLDMFLLNHSVNHDGNYAPRNNFINTYDSLAGQKFYRNDSRRLTPDQYELKFTDITRASGINGSKIGYGLGVAVSDVNLDGWPDFYVSNDFHENDYLYINQRNGTFRDESGDRLMHTSQFSMGVDVADVSNDGYPEIISMDMLPYDPYILKRSLGEDDYTIFFEKIKYGYNYQYARNNLQYNRRNGLFSETGVYSGVFATDWSWAPLWMDFDNDGRKDLFISNGIPKRMNDIDYINFVSSDDVQQKLRNNRMEEKDMSLTKKFPEIKIPNKFYSNKGALLFEDIGTGVDNNQPTYSNGAVYADLDNDGDLDIVVNNINEEALVYENKNNDKKDHAYVSLQLEGPAPNRNAVGARVIVFAGAELRVYEQNPVHGFLSSMQTPLHIGLYQSAPDSAFVVWPDNHFQSLRLQKDTLQRIVYQSGLPLFDYNILTRFIPNTSFPVQDMTMETGLSYRHNENYFREFEREPLIPRMLSTEGPAAAVADINQDGLDDIFIGAAKGSRNAVFVQTPAGKFVKKEQPGMYADSMWENTDAVWADVNKDSYPDLLLASGGNEYYGGDQHLLPLLYLNDGKGNLSRKTDAFTGITSTQSAVAVQDFNKDGYPDLFLAGRAVPWAYGQLPRSYLLQNDGTGRFTDVTEKICPALSAPGFVTSARWTDMNSDGQADLLLTYEWGGIDLFIQEKNAFKKSAVTTLSGWWNGLVPIDIDKDGDLDLVAGNQGLNTRLKPTAAEPITLYYNDFDGNGKKEQVLTYYLDGKETAFATKMDLEKQMPAMKKSFLYAEDFSKASLASLFGATALKEALTYKATSFSSAVFINKGNLQFEYTALPFEAQLTALRSAAVVNANGDEWPDLFIGGNFYANNIELGRNDADFGGLLLNNGKGGFTWSPLNNFSIKGEIRRILPVQVNQQTLYLTVRNNDSALLLQFQPR